MSHLNKRDHKKGHIFGTEVSLDEKCRSTYSSQLFQIDLGSLHLFPFDVERAGALGGETDLVGLIIVVVVIGDHYDVLGPWQRTAAHFVLVDLLLFLVLWAHDLETLAVHLGLRVVVVAEHGLAINVRLVEGAEEGLALDLKSIDRLAQVLLLHGIGKGAAYFVEALFHVLESVAFAESVTTRDTADLYLVVLKELLLFPL